MQGPPVSTLLLTLMTVANPGAFATEMYYLSTQEMGKPPDVSRQCPADILHGKAHIPGLFQLLGGPCFLAAEFQF